jgi:Helix-turn-helix domain
MSDPGPASDESAPLPLLLRKHLLMSTFVRQPQAAIADASVLSALIERYNDAKGSAWPSLSALAEDCGRDRRTVQRSLQRLVRAGFVAIVQRGSRTASNHYLPRFEAGAAMRLGRGADAPTGRGVDAATGRGAHAPLTHTNEPVRVQWGGSASAAAVPASAAAPEKIDPLEWAKLFAARPDLSPSDIAEAVEYHRTEGCPTEALNRALVGLRLNRGHRSLSPAYKRSQPSRNAKAAAKETTPTTKAAPSIVTRPSANVFRMVASVHPLVREFARIFRGSNVKAAEKARLVDRLRREFPQHVAAFTAPPGYGPGVSVEKDEHVRIAAMLAAEWALISGRLKAKAAAHKARHSA